MPRIRKKTSKRVTTHRRERVKRKVAEGRRKKKKEAKKNPQWKSKKKKDPVIPNEFPYKDQILAEVAESRRQVEEAKRLRKEEKKAAREGLVAKNDDDGGAPVPSAAGIEECSSSGRQLRDVDAVPLLLNPDLPNFQAVLDKADVVLHVLDARDPISYRVTHVEELAGTKLAYVLNKIDIVPREALAAWRAHLRVTMGRPTFVFRAASAFLPMRTAVMVNSKGKGKESDSAASSADAVGADALRDYLADRAREMDRGTLHVAVVGITNTGKSSIVNSLARKAVMPVYSPTASADASSTTTTTACAVPLPPITGPAATAGETTQSTVTIIDTPGITFRATDDTTRVRDLLLRNRGRPERLKDPFPAAAHIVERVPVAADLMVHYALPAFTPGDASAFFMVVARTRALLGRGGSPDMRAAARLVLRDWAIGAVPFCAEPPPDDTRVEAADAAGLDGVKTRGEMRRGVGLVRIRPGDAETRRMDVEREFVEREAEDDGEDSDNEEWHGFSADEEAGSGEEDEDELNGVDDESDEKENGNIGANGKRKHTRMAETAARPAKKVAFAEGTRGGKESTSSKKASQKPALKRVQVSTTNPASKPLQRAVQKRRADAGDTDAYDFTEFFK